MRYLVGRPITLTHEFWSDDDSAAKPTIVIVTITRDGEQVYAGSAALAGDVYTVPVVNLPVGLYEAQWSGGDYTDVTHFEVSGTVLFNIGEARRADENLTADRFPAAEIVHYRYVVESEFETITGRSFVDRVGRVRVTIEDGSALVPMLDVRAVTALSGPDGPVDLSVATLDPYGRLGGLTGLASGTYEATVRYGFAEVPADIKRVGIIRLRTLLTADRTGVPDRATSFTATEGGTFTLATPGRAGYQTGIPEVDATLDRYTYTILRDVVAHGQ